MRTMTIEQALRWAYREELPKSPSLGDRLTPACFPRGWEEVEHFGDYLALIDEPVPLNRFGLVADFTADEGPHPDAVTIHEAVNALDAFPVDVPDDWYPLADMGDLGDLGREAVARALDRIAPVGRDGERWMRAKPAALIQKHAILGGEPDWEGDAPEIRFVAAPNGEMLWFRMEDVVVRPADEKRGLPAELMRVEVDGRNRRTKRPYVDAYRKMYLSPDPAPIVVHRAEYQMWRAALDSLVDELAGRLLSVRVAASHLPQCPWEPTHTAIVIGAEN